MSNRTDPRRRSRSPVAHSDSPISKSRRTRSPRVSHRHHSIHKRSHAHRLVILPFQASNLSKHDFGIYKPIFKLYLDIQKQLVLEELSKDEVRGRWKRFVGKWNRGELAEGWYDSATLRKAQESVALTSREASNRCHQQVMLDQVHDGDGTSDDDVGPALPGEDRTVTKTAKRSGPAIPNLQDLELRRELADEDILDHRQILHQERLQDRKKQKEHIDELAPRAEAGTKDRMLEKKREKADNNRAFALAKTDTGGFADVPDADLLGGDDRGIEGFKKQKREMDRKKNEREIRREEILKARQEEREQRVQVYRAKEEKTMSGLVALAKARFG